MEPDNDDSLTMNIAEISDAGADTLWMMSHYTGVAGQGELGADRLFYGLLQGQFGNITRQHAVAAGRIDFRYGTTNPVVIELVLRSSHDSRAQLYARTNRSELSKLTRVRSARMRVLLLLDRSRDPIAQDILRANYRNEHAGRGNFARHSVRVIYVHQNGAAYHFSWNPFA